MQTRSHSRSASSMRCVESRVVAPRALALAHQLLEQFDVQRVQTAERLVEHQQIRLVQDHAEKLRLLGHPLGKGLDLVVRPVPESHGFEPRPCQRQRLLAPHSLELAEEGEVVDGRHLLIQPPFLGEVSDAGAHGVDVRRSENLGRAGVGTDDVQDDPQRGGLFRPRWAQ